MNQSRTTCVLIALVLGVLWAWAPTLSAQDSDGDGRARVGGPNAVENQLRDDANVDRPSLFDRYFAWKDGLTKKHHLSFGIDYSAAFLGADSSPGDDRASGGMVRFFGSWDLTGRGTTDTGALIWKIEHRHAYTDVAPNGFGFNLGYVGLIEPPFSDEGARLTNLYWRQRLGDDRFTVIGGFLDATDYVDVYMMASPWTGFLNFAFSTGTTTMALPNDATLGIAAHAMITDKLYIIGGIADLNSDPTDPSETIDSFFSDHEYYKHVEIGWTTSPDRIYFDNVHLTLWHADERAEAGNPSGWGANFSYAHYLNSRWMPFVRAGYTKDAGSLTQKSVSVGVAYQKNPNRSLLGFGLNWGEPNETTWGPGLDDQYTAELFYRWQASKALAITPDIQYLKDPALNQEVDAIWVVGIRVRAAL